MTHRTCVRAAYLRLALASMLVVGPLTACVCADGGTLQVTQTIGDYDVAVFTDPAPLRAGPVDVSVWVQQASTNRLVDVEVTVTARNTVTQQVIRVQATREAATNKLLQAAPFEMSAGGTWQFTIEVRPITASNHSDPVQIAFTAEVAPRLPPWRELAGWILWPVVPIGLFGAHLYLASRTKRGRVPSTAVATQAADS